MVRRLKLFESKFDVREVHSLLVSVVVFYCCVGFKTCKSICNRYMEIKSSGATIEEHSSPRSHGFDFSVGMARSDR